MAIAGSVDANIPGVVGAKRVTYSVAADTEIVAAVSGKQIHVLGWIAYSLGGTTSAGTGTLGSSTALVGAFGLTAAPMVIPPTSTKLGSTVAGEALNLELSATDANTGVIWWVVDP